jgi:cystathionine beta-lyase/cystathionine gamma-synthase
MVKPIDPRAKHALGLGTRAAHAATARSAGVAQPLVQPLYQSTVFRFDSVAQVDAVYQGEESGHVYYRMGTPNSTALEAAVAELEGAESGVAAASGMGTISALLLALAKAGDHLVADRHAYGGTYGLLTGDLPRLGIEATLVDVSDLAAVRAALRPNTRALLVETLSNPTLRVADVPGLVAVARERGIPVLVDNSFTSPVLIRPIEHGADVSWHSLAKYLGGHSSGMGGIAVGRLDLIEAARQKVVHLGASLGPFDAWMVGQGLPTLSLRVDRHSTNALAVAGFLAEHRGVSRVLYPGLPSHRDHDLATRLFGGRYGGMIAFSVKGGRSGAEEFLRSLDLIAFAPSLADVRTMVSYPVATSHRGLPPATLQAMDIDAGLIRLSVGIEDVDDIIADLDRALAAAPAGRGS